MSDIPLNGCNGGSTPSLFVGNLSIFVTEKDIEALFDKHISNDDTGDRSVDVKIIRSDKSVSLGYGFVNMRSEVEAEKAMAALNGKQFYGRPLQVNWAVRNIKKSISSPEVDHPAANSVHVKFSTVNRGPLIIEETIWQFFAKYEEVHDVFIKYSCFNKVTGLQKGYAFVHFSESLAGQEAAMIAAAEVTGNCLVRLECQPSKNLLKRLRDSEAVTKRVDMNGPNRPENDEGNVHIPNPGFVPESHLRTASKPADGLCPSSNYESPGGSTMYSAITAAVRSHMPLRAYMSGGSSLSNSGHGYQSSSDTPQSPCPAYQLMSFQSIQSLETSSDFCNDILTNIHSPPRTFPAGSPNVVYRGQYPFQQQQSNHQVPISPIYSDSSCPTPSTVYCDNHSGEEFREAYNNNGYALGAKHQAQEELYQQRQQQQHHHLQHRLEQQQQQQQQYQYPGHFESYQYPSQLSDGSIYYGPVQPRYQSHILPHQVAMMPQLGNEEFVYAPQSRRHSLPLPQMPVSYTVHNPNYGDMNSSQRIVYPSVPVFSASSVGLHYGYVTQHLGPNNGGSLSVSPVTFSYSTPTSGTQTPMSSGTYTPVSVAYTPNSVPYSSSTRSPAEYISPVSNSIPIINPGLHINPFRRNDVIAGPNDAIFTQQLKFNKSKKNRQSKC